MVKVLGIDEAGRGPVIGPMIMSGVMIDEDKVESLGNARDSKLVSHKERVELDRDIRENKEVEYEVIVIDPEVIDGALLSEELNLNWLEAHKQAEIINKLKPDKAIIDCPSINVESFEKYLRVLLDNSKMELVVEHKADANYKVCAAASILAKVEREKQMDQIRSEVGDCGPGYPSNRITQEFVKNNWNKYPKIFRKTWSTYKRVVEAQGQKEINDY